MTPFSFRRVLPNAVEPMGQAVLDDATLDQAREIVGDVREGGEAALRGHARRLGDLQAGDPLVYGRDELQAVLDSTPEPVRELLRRSSERIRTFAQAQRDSLADLTCEVLGGQAGHTVAPIDVAGCYAPGGRFPLPSSVLMTAVTARVAGVTTVVVASPRPAPVTLAAAAVADADLFLTVGGAQAIAALAYGAGPVPACDVVVGPGNRWVTAAKQIVAGQVAIDMLAGPSELAVVADDSADPAVVAADLLAQAEHDPDALPVLIATEQRLVDAVERELSEQLSALPTPTCAGDAMARGFAVVVSSRSAAVSVCNRLAPEHLALHVRNPQELMPELNHYGALFLGQASAEGFGDYGAGPNHVLPTGGTARTFGGLSVFSFLRVRTWLRLTEGESLDALGCDVAAFARLEKLEAHARSTELRQS
ncbi:MAG: histidinol dehydrogenase [bacterium]|nr:histidinol dehydrogenase [bacterium]